MTRTLLLLFSLLFVSPPAHSQFWKKWKKQKQTDIDTTLVVALDTTALLADTVVMKFAERENYIPSERDTITDLDIVMPHSMNNDSLLTDWYGKNYILIDTACITAKDIPTFSDSIIAQRLSTLPTLIEMPYNQIVRSYIDNYTKRSRAFTAYLVGASDHYMPLFEQELERAGLPLELKYLPIIESALKPEATSRAGAAGLWQFMVGTSKIYGLETNSLIDERRDPIKSTQAAVRFLQDLYDIYNDWTLAIAAYNCGPGNVNKAIRRTGGKRDYWQIYYYLPRETRGYVPAFIAANYVMNFYEEHEICPAYVEIPQANDTVMIDQRIDLLQVANALGTPIEQVRLLNPQYRQDIVPGNTKPYALRLPNDELLAFIDQQDTIIARSLTERRLTAAPAGYSTAGTPSGSYILHKIQSGESLSTIAARYGVGVSTLKQWNNLYSSRITAGKSLRIYGKAAESKSAAPASSEAIAKYANWKGDVAYHTVKSGENLWVIAQKYSGVTVDHIKAINNLKSNSLMIGQQLKIPKV